MSPEARIARLDRQLAQKSETIVLKRRAADGSAWVPVTIQAKKSGFTADELVGDLAQQDSLLIFSPTLLAAASWPGEGNGEAVPGKGDIAVIGGADTIVLAGTAIRSGETVIRLEARVRGAAN